MKIGVFSDKNPFGYVDENGDVQGYDIYFGKRLAKDLLGSEDAVSYTHLIASAADWEAVSEPPFIAARYLEVSSFAASFVLGLLKSSPSVVFI